MCVGEQSNISEESTSLHYLLYILLQAKFQFQVKQKP
jgi:hypothetical protein